MIILASTSPRRRELLKLIIDDFTIIDPKLDEDKVEYEVHNVTQILSYAKASAVLQDFKNDVIIGSDTIIMYNGQIIGKPINKDDAIKTLKLLSGHHHFVITSYTIMNNRKHITETIKTKVQFNVLSDEEICQYVDLFNPLDKAGSYGIQDNFPLIKSIKGSYYNVMGLPILSLQKTLKVFI